MTVPEYLDIFDRANVLPFYPGKDPNQKGDRFPMRKAKEAAAVHRQHLGGRTVVFVGRQTAHAFGFQKATMDFWEWRVCRDWGFRCTVIPHTSGCNRYWNDEENRAAAEKFFREQIFST